MLVTVGMDVLQRAGQPYLGWYLESVTYKVLGITRHGWLDTGSETGSRALRAGAMPKPEARLARDRVD